MPALNNLTIEKNKYMNSRYIKYFLLVFLSIVTIGNVYAQQKTVTGVVSSQGEPLPGVNVVIAGTTNGTITDIMGNYSISVTSTDVLQFSFIGFDNQEVPVGDQVVININLVESTMALNEVVAIGFGKAKKGDLTSSITSVTGDDMKTMTVGNPTEALQGKAAGVQVVAGSGAPGAQPQVLIRGITSVSLSTDPLYVVDGVPMGNSINFLNTNEIESMQVLKDASASAIYGSRASNGVILITTKRGKEGKTTYSADVTYGTQVFKKPYEMANATEYAQIMNQSLANSGLDARFPDPGSLGAGTDWWGEGVNKFSPTLSAGIQANGGTEKYKFAYSFNYFSQESFYNSGNWDKFTARISNDLKINDYISAGFVLNPRREKWQNTPNWYQDYLVIDPITPILVPEADREGLSEFDIYQRSYYTYTWNPIGRDARNFNESGNYALGYNANITITPIKNLEIKSQLGGDLQFNHSDSFNPEFSIDEAHESNKINQVSRNKSQDNYWNWTNTATYEFNYSEHKLSAMIGNTLEKWTGSDLWGSKEGTPNNTDLLRELNAATSNPLNGGTRYENTVQSYLGRLSYNLKDKYYLTATYRTDGSSKFLANNKWAAFPSGSFAWRVSKESFMDGVDFVDDLKFRAGWGRVGNQSLPAAVYLSGMGQYYYVFGPGEGSLVNTSYPSTMKNEDIKWETVEDVNLGLDWTLFNSALSGSFEYYQKKTKDMIFQKRYPNYSGYPSNATIYTNVGNMENKGWEIAVNYQGVVSKFKYNVGVTLTTVDIEMTNLPDAPLYGPEQKTKTVEGDVPGFFFGFKTDGIFQNQTEINSHASENGTLMQPYAKPGDVRFVDTNNDGLINTDDRVKIGSPWADFTGGLNVSLGYSNFDLVANVYFSVGNDLVNETKSALYSTTGSDNNVLSGLLDQAWHGEGTSNTIPRVSHDDQNENFTRFSDFYVEDGSFARLKNLQIGYTLANNVAEKMKLSKCRIYVSGQNILTLTGYEGMNPEIGGSAINFGFGGWDYPVLPTYLVGVNLVF